MAISLLLAGVSLAAGGFYLGKNWDKSQLRRQVGEVSRAVADLDVLYRDLLESHKRLRSKERMQEMRASAPSAANRSVPDGVPPTITFKDQLRIKAGLIPRRAVSSQAPSDE